MSLRFPTCQKHIGLAAWLGIGEKEVRRLLDPRHPSKLPRIAEILGRVGKRIVVGIEDDKEVAAAVLDGVA